MSQVARMLELVAQIRMRGEEIGDIESMSVAVPNRTGAKYTIYIVRW